MKYNLKRVYQEGEYKVFNKFCLRPTRIFYTKDNVEYSETFWLEDIQMLCRYNSYHRWETISYQTEQKVKIKSMNESLDSNNIDDMILIFGIFNYDIEKIKKKDFSLYLRHESRKGNIPNIQNSSLGSLQSIFPSIFGSNLIP